MAHFGLVLASKVDIRLPHPLALDTAGTDLVRIAVDRDGVRAKEHAERLHSEVAMRTEHPNSPPGVRMMRKEISHLEQKVRSREFRGLLGNDTTLKQEYPYFHTSGEIRSKVKRLAGTCNGALTTKTVQDSGDSNVSIDVVSIRARNANPVNRIFMLFGEHSRELISPESGLFFVRALCGDAEKTRFDKLGGVSKLLQDTEFQIVLNANPRSRLRVEAGEYCVRENPRGVDLNRNWDEKWQAKSTDLVDTDPGPRPFSEPETRIFRDLVTEFKPTVFLTVHSGTRGMYMPWAYDTEHEGTSNRADMMHILRSLDGDHCTCPFGAAGKEVGYPCPGTCLDWVYAKMNTPFVFAFEIFAEAGGDESLRQRWKEITSRGDNLLQDGLAHLGHAPYRDFFQEHPSDFVQLAHGSRDAISTTSCFPVFNPSTKESYDDTVKNWATAYWRMSQMTARSLKTNSSLI